MQALKVLHKILRDACPDIQCYRLRALLDATEGLLVRQ